VRVIQEFKQFILRGNVVDLAVGIIIGLAFADVVQSLVDNLISPLIGLFGGVPDLSEATFTAGGSVFRYGAFLTAILTFLITAFVVFLFVVKPINHLVTRARREAPPDPTTKRCPFCTLDIPMNATRCPNCTGDLAIAS
jgi:large conductance mechanosensitive channel